MLLRHKIGLIAILSVLIGVAVVRFVYSYCNNELTVLVLDEGHRGKRGDKDENIGNKRGERQKKQRKRKHRTRSKNHKKDLDIIIDLNTASREDLQKLDGIGKVYAGRIYEYGKSLGGYTEIEQLKEVKGIGEKRYEKIFYNIRLKTKNIRKININTFNEQELSRHPYIDRNMAEQIVDYRKRKGRYNNVSEIRKVRCISEEKYRKLKPYLTTEQP